MGQSTEGEECKQTIGSKCELLMHEFEFKLTGELDVAKEDLAKERADSSCLREELETVTLKA